MEGPRGTRDHPISTKDMQNRCPRMAAYQQIPRNEGMTGLTRSSHAAADWIPPPAVKGKECRSILILRKENRLENEEVKVERSRVVDGT